MHRHNHGHEAGLDTFAAGAFRLGMMLCLLVVVIVACVSLAGPRSAEHLERVPHDGCDLVFAELPRKRWHGTFAVED